MGNRVYLTKSRFKLATECPTKLYYTGKTKEHADTKNDDEFLQSLAEGGLTITQRISGGPTAKNETS